MKYRVLLSDADGTLWDFAAGEPIALSGTFDRFGIPYTPEMVALYEQANRALWKQLELGQITSEKLHVQRFADFLSLAGLMRDAQAVSDDYLQRLGNQRQVLPGAEQLCRAVSAHMPIYLITNGISAIQRSRLHTNVLAPYITGMVVSDEIGHAKPDPAMLFEALRRANVRPEEAILLGDSVSADVAAANSAGMDCILYTGEKPIPKNHEATWAVRTLSDATNLILQP